MVFLPSHCKTKILATTDEHQAIIWAENEDVLKLGNGLRNTQESA